MKITIIGGGNVGGLAAMRIAQERLGDVLLIDVVNGLACGKAFDMEDACSLLKYPYSVTGSDDIKQLKDSDVIVVTAGLARKPGMTREDLLLKNAQILQSICSVIKEQAPKAILIMVTNPLDLMTRFALKNTGFTASRVFGMGVTLDASRFANLISKELKIPVTDIQATVIGSHGEGMIPLPRFTTIKGVGLDEFFKPEKLTELAKRTFERGKEIVSLLGSGSAYFAPSAAILELVRAVVKDEKRILGVSAYLNGEYGISDVCLGLPCRIGKNGREEIIKLELNKEEKEALLKSAASFKEQYNLINNL